jgi:hypothetical protein
MSFIVNRPTSLNLSILISEGKRKHQWFL